MEPVKVALIGCGRRGQAIYYPILHALKEYVEVTAVCDRVPELGRNGGEEFGVPVFDSLDGLVRARPMEAAIVVTPGSSHYAISCFLSSHGVHNLIETPICDTVRQARLMVETAERNNVIFRVGEQFFRSPFDLLSRKLVEADVIGPVGRITNYHSHVGYHNNSRFQVFAGGAPLAVSALEHTMPVQPYNHGERNFSTETFRSRSFYFPSNLLVTDIAGNIKSALGRYSRPGLVEIDGARGTIMQLEAGHWRGRCEVRLVPEYAFMDRSGAFSESYPIYCNYRQADGGLNSIELHEKATTVTAEGAFAGVSVSLPQGAFEVPNEFLQYGLETAYHPEVAGHVRDFAQLIRNGSPDLFPNDMAVMSLVMEQAAALSSRSGNRVVEMDDANIETIDEERGQLVRQEFGYDALDIEAMIRHVFPKI